MRVLLAVVLTLAIASTAYAQLSGDLIRGQYGLASGTQGPEGVIVTFWFYDFYSTQIVGPDEAFQSTGSARGTVPTGFSPCLDS